MNDLEVDEVIYILLKQPFWITTSNFLSGISQCSLNGCNGRLYGRGFIPPKGNVTSDMNAYTAVECFVY